MIGGRSNSKGEKGLNFPPLAATAEQREKGPKINKESVGGRQLSLAFHGRLLPLET